MNATRELRRMLVGLAILGWGGSCSTVQNVDLEPSLGEAEEPVPHVAKRLKVAVLRFEEPKPRSTALLDEALQGSSGDGAPNPSGKPPAATAQRSGTATKPPKPAAPPPLPNTTAEFTARYSEAYPSSLHMMNAVPAALTEMGFEVVKVASVQEAQSSGAAMILELMSPEIEAFRNASAGGPTLEGAVMDTHVHYRARVTTPAGQKLGLVSGHGESSTHFLFVDPFVETAVVGLVSLGLSGVVTAMIGIPAAVVFYMTLTNRTNPLGLCRADRLPERPSENSPDPVTTCVDMAGLLVQTAMIGLVVAAASGTMAVSQFFAKRVFSGVTSTIKQFVTDPMWKGMLKKAHDRAARSLAESVVHASGRLGRLPLKPRAAMSTPGGSQDG